MSNIVPASSTALVASRQSRYTGKALARLDSHTEIEMAKIESTAELQVGRVMALTYVGKRAMHEVAMLSQLEQQLATLVPMATSRLQAIGDIVALEAADLVADSVRRLR
jgi:hypothetical protein